MKHPRLAWLVLAVFAILLVSWLIASFNYPQTIYDYRQTDRLVEWFDRASGWAVDAVPIWIPDNPLWVDIIRKIAPFGLFALFMACLYFVLVDRKVSRA